MSNRRGRRIALVLWLTCVLFLQANAALDKTGGRGSVGK